MTPEELQSLWQQQPVEAPPAFTRDQATPLVDYAAPTSKDAPAPRRAFPWLIAAAVAAVFIALLSMLVAREPVRLPVVVDDPLAECRRLTDTTRGEPDWVLAESVCTKAAGEEPMSRDAMLLLPRVAKLARCQGNERDGERLLRAGDAEAALMRFVQVTPDCTAAFARVTPGARTLAPVVEARARTACEQAMRERDGTAVELSCARYAMLACQQRDLSSDATHRAWLALQTDPSAWSCPEVPALRPPAVKPAPEADLVTMARTNAEEPRLGEAAAYYLRGDVTSARALVAGLLRDSAASAHHARARELDDAMRDVETAQREFELTRDEAPLQALLDADQRVLVAAKMDKAMKGVGVVQRRASDVFGRRMYEAGRLAADERDWPKACALWKHGSLYTRANIDLLKALTNVCTRRASEAFDSAERCDDLDKVKAYAVDGDGFAERADRTAAEWRCR